MKKEYYIFLLLFLIGFTVFAFRKKNKKIMPFFGKLLKEKQKIRPCDLAGCGGFGAEREDHVHMGVDVVAPAGTKVYSPINGIIRRLYVYPNNTEMRGVEISNGNFKTKIFYLDSPFQTGERISQGDFIGYAQNVARFYNDEGKMINHIHVEIRKNGKLINPTKYIQN